MLHRSAKKRGCSLASTNEQQGLGKGSGFGCETLKVNADLAMEACLPTTLTAWQWLGLCGGPTQSAACP